MKNEKCKFQIGAAHYCKGLGRLRLRNKFTIFILQFSIFNIGSQKTTSEIE